MIDIKRLKKLMKLHEKQLERYGKIFEKEIKKETGIKVKFVKPSVNEDCAKVKK